MIGPTEWCQAYADYFAWALAVWTSFALNCSLGISGRALGAGEGGDHDNEKIYQGCSTLAFAWAPYWSVGGRYYSQSARRRNIIGVALRTGSVADDL
jgi:hypothetical protein